MMLKKPILFVFAISLFIFWSKMTSPFSANVSPVIALALIAGFLGQGRWYGFVMPLMAFAASDYLIGLYPGWAFTYIPLVLIVVFGHFMKERFSSFMLSGFVGASVFFLLSNLGVWFYSGLYSQDWAGLSQCYRLAVPFFRTSLLSTLFFMGLFSLSLSFVSKYSLTQGNQSS